MRLETDDGLVGYGETCPLGLDLPPGARGGRAGGAARARAGADRRRPAQPERVWAAHGRRAARPRLRQGGGRHRVLGPARPGRGLPVSTLLGGVRATDFPLYVAIPLGPVDDDGRARARRPRARASGASSSSSAPTRARTRRACGRCWRPPRPTSSIIADANGGWRLQDAVIAARALEGLDRVLFEQPCPTLEECLVVRERTTLPMVLDEVITDVDALLRARPAMDGDQPQDRPRRRAHARRELMRDLGVRARPAVHDRGQLGRRPHDRRGRAPRGLDAARRSC